MKTTLKTFASAALGAAAGAIQQIIVSAGMDLAKVDWHKTSMIAIGTALVAVIAHWFPPPNAK